jgi:cupin 2 domain-containing protein
MDVSNIFDKINKNSTEEVFTTLLKNDNIKIEKIVSTGQSSPEGYWYDQEQDEFIFLVSGKATLEFKNEGLVVLKSGDYLFVPAHKKHRVKNTLKDDVTIWLAIFT